MSQILLTTINNIHKNDIEILGQNFNIFNVLKLDTDEVRLHSRYLADLLNPFGSHGYRDEFLKTFLLLIGETTLFPELSRVTVYAEKFIGPVTPTSGGQIDILMEDNQNNVLIIENKINAGDQKNQLLRYRNFGNQYFAKGGSFRLIYLTKNGLNAHPISLGENEMTHYDYKCISYKTEIRNWLENLIEKTTKNKKLSNTLEQYHQLILQLTGMATNEKLDLTINELIHSSENFKAAEQISNALNPAKQKLLHSFIQKVVAELKPEFPSLNFEISPDFGQRYQGLEIHHTVRIECETFSHIRLSFLSEASDCYIEIHPGITSFGNNEKSELRRKQYKALLETHFHQTVAKIQNTETAWQGEWVAHYYPLQDIFDLLINQDVNLKNRVKTDLSTLILAFEQTHRLV
jgi:hypothetical protein